MPPRQPRQQEDPVSIVLSPALRRRVSTEASRRGLKLSPTIRVLIGERLKDIDDFEGMTRAERWQREQVWSTWERIQEHGFEEASDAELEKALNALPKARTRRRKR
ncbi:MAG: hypothetical protein IT381_17930 [Deltaproteobacteria bacterium]|nr:hypothetical protein [Deltaproteobacteria bacterium]